ncbi:NAD(P)/FAD-dependent oxidoreductase [Hymenobacter volaticus]|uniref:NAD(P)-binding protein n=1 Tax=Hymenobacter volaticus TaxID=2932254 RepID=A0ABY4G9D5_9BACT|nr:NAD(P)/FAD-dependent oxidoreductase [Hymenobacter volaticus]UOQ67472.1 NAD(P)-binding protein [Hymenobacter volaticus]
MAFRAKKLAASTLSFPEKGLGADLPRRTFLQQAGLGLAGVLLAPVGLLESCAPGTVRAHIQGALHGANHATGHLLRQPDKLPPPTRTVRTEVLIIGGGVAGLAARRELHLQGQTNTLLLELDERVGGNASAGRNQVSAYPWGAHYLPIPDSSNSKLLAFLRESDVITGFAADTGLPIYNEYYLCHDPEERLSIHGHWQQGLVPDAGVPAADRAEIARFFKLIEELKQARGKDGKEAFTIPVDHSSTDPTYRQLDSLSFADYLTQHGYTSPYLRWYLDYGCRDDYGAPAAAVSAWAGLHYFAARKGRAHNASASDVLTWPQGNNFLIEQLRRQASAPISTGMVAYQLRETTTGLDVLAYDVTTQQTVRVEAQQVLLATPQFVTQRLLAGLTDAPDSTLTPYHAPWLVANLTVDGLPQGPGQPLCWDNVRYGSTSVGYVNANHQNLSLHADGSRVITMYWPLCDEPPEAARRRAYQTSYDEWVKRLLAELEIMHPGVTPHVRRADVWIWGHGMVAPTPGYLWGPGRVVAAQPWRNKLFFAHTDLSGISIFEEGFYQGIRAAHEMLAVS